MRYVLLVLAVLLTACKTVEVPIPAAYPLAYEKAVAVDVFQGEQGKQLSWRVSATLKEKLPNLVMYEAKYLPRGGLVMQGQVLSWHMGDGNIEWGDYDEESHRQHGTASRRASMHVRILLMRENTGEVVWSDAFEDEVNEREYFDFSSPEAVNDDDAVEDLLEKKVREALVHLRLQRRLALRAEAKIPSKLKIRNLLLNKVSKRITRSFYDRVETHLEFK